MDYVLFLGIYRINRISRVPTPISGPDSSKKWILPVLPFEYFKEILLPNFPIWVIKDYQPFTQFNYTCYHVINSYDTK